MREDRWSVRGPRAQSFLFAWIAFVAVGVALRVVFVLAGDVSHSAGTLARVFARGALEDGLTAIVVMAPLAVVLALLSDGIVARARLRFFLLAAIGAALTFSCFVEYFFFEEFDSRFNHIALDYLLFPGEVAGNIWESYPVPLYVAGSLVVGFALALAYTRLRGNVVLQKTSISRRLAGSAVAILTACLAVFALTKIPATNSGDRHVDEVSANGLVQLVRAYSTARLPYEEYYHTLQSDRANELAATELGWQDVEHPGRDFHAVERREKPLDVVLILEESLGSEFVGRLGGRKPCTPGLERWSHEGLFLTNLVPTGNRTVRGLEGVLCSFVPLPGDSIWKRDKSDDVASIARVLKENGYTNRFFYGGAGAFDGMRSFAMRNGWDEFIEDGLFSSSYPKDAFRTIWGVADETLFDTVLASQVRSAKAGERSFATVLTVSNHKPYLTPDDPASGLSGTRLTWFAVCAGLMAIANFFAWKQWGARFGRVRIALLSIAAWGAFGIWAWSSSRPHGSRESAVRYADRALAQYFDKARAAGLMEHTVFLVVGDHGARVYGSEQIPAESYRIPALFLAPEASRRDTTIDALCSQIDLAPTLLSLAGVDYRAPFMGVDLLSQPPDRPGRAYLIHNRDIGLLTDKSLVVLGL
jgi:phosphoglycerol transferase MdoB-like AlkP superfamily enzyme